MMAASAPGRHLVSFLTALILFIGAVTTNAQSNVMNPPPGMPASAGSHEGLVQVPPPESIDSSTAGAPGNPEPQPYPAGSQTPPQIPAQAPATSPSYDPTQTVSAPADPNAPPINPPTAQPAPQISGAANAAPGTPATMPPLPQAAPAAPLAPGTPGVPGAAGAPGGETTVTAPSEIIDVVQGDNGRRRTLAIFRTSMGNFTVQLFTRQAPRTTQNFIELARGDKEFIDAKTGRKVRRPFYNGLIFHRIQKNFVIQGGCPFGTGKGGPGFTIADEFTPALRHRRAGMVSMANANQPDTNGSQFFITLSPQPEFDDKYTVFGEVVQGMETVREIARAKVGPTERPIKRIYIIAIDIVEE